MKPRMQRVWNGRKMVYRIVAGDAAPMEVPPENREAIVAQAKPEPKPMSDIEERRRLAAEIAKSL